MHQENMLYKNSHNFISTTAKLMKINISVRKGCLYKHLNFDASRTLTYGVINKLAL